METDKVVQVLGALAQETRLDAFRVLVRAGRSGIAAGEIARKLDISDGTVKVYVRNLCRKLGQRNRTQLATLAVVNDARSGWMDQENGEPAA